MIKKFEHKKIETCSLCSKPISTIEDLWIALIDFKGKSTINLKFYHNTCLQDLIKGQGRVIQQKFEDKLRNFTNKMFSGIKNMDTSQLQINLENLSK